MTVLRHNDYQGSVEFDSGSLIVRILHIDDFITTEVDSASQAQAAFVELVDDYVQSCLEVGREPCKPFKGSFNVRVTPKLHKQVAQAAAQDGESLNSYVVSAIEEKIRSGEIEEISASVARTMATYVVTNRTDRYSSQWDYIDTLPVRPISSCSVSILADDEFTQEAHNIFKHMSASRKLNLSNWVIRGAK